ncbi:MAG TPA: hypothetical protein VJM33_13220 [Microthrixaceae bacterium]|nr:hypothetical protein [Microthrixaceae bacterium]
MSTAGLRPPPGWEVVEVVAGARPRPALIAGDGPLCLLLHGHGASARSIVCQARAGVLVEAGMRVVAPQGVGHSWSAADDASVLAAICTQWGGSEATVAGFSEGAAMAYRLGFDRSDLVARVVAVGGVPPGLPSGRTGPHVLHVHGSADRRVPLGGVRRSEAGRHRLASPLRRLDRLVAMRRLRWGEAEVVCGGTAWTAPDPVGGAAVQLVVVDGVGHAWPGGVRLDATGDDPRSEFDATRAILELVCRPTMEVAR